MDAEKLKNIHQLLSKNNLEAILVSSLANIIYLTDYANFSMTEREGYLFITRDAQYVITDGRYSEAVLKQIPGFILVERNIKNSFVKILQKLIQKYSVKKLGIEEENLTVSEYKQLLKIFPNLKNFNLTDSRIIKTAEEIVKVEKACQIGDKAFGDLLKKIKSGVSEKQISHNLDLLIKKSDSAFSFDPIIAFGPNSSIPHHQTSNTKLTKQPAQFVLIDMGAKFENYCSDMTRTIFFGKASLKQKKMYRVVLEAQGKAAEYINNTHKSGKIVKASQADKISREHILSQNFPNIPHSLGHGIGLEVHEIPHLSLKSDGILKPGMVFSIEPGIYIPNFGGVRIEDLYVLEENGLRQLTKSSKNLTELD